MRLQLPHAIAVAAAVFAVSGCGSTLGIRLERYDLDYGARAGTVAEARAAYQDAHPANVVYRIADQRDDMAGLAESVSSYRAFLTALNRVGDILALREPGSKDDVIVAAFEPLEVALTREVERLDRIISEQGGSKLAVPPNGRVMDNWTTLQQRLSGSQVFVKGDEVQRLMTQLAEGGEEVLLQLVQQAADDLGSLPSAGPASATGQIAEFAQALKNANDRAGAAAGLRKFGQQLDSQAVRLTDQLAGLEQVGGDNLKRRADLYQDMSDPFLAYIASHPYGWQPLGNEATVFGDGDTQYILVFENLLDARWKSVTVDPTKIIKARLNIARRTAQLLTGLLGVPAADRTVPMPPGVGGASMTFSSMTGAEQTLRSLNEAIRSEMEDLRAFAAEALTELDEETVDVITDQLVRRLARLKAYRENLLEGE